MTDHCLPPHNREAERVVLGSILRLPACLDEVRDSLDASAFYFDAHALIFRGLLALADERKPVDLVALAEVLGADRTREAGGAARDPQQVGIGVRVHGSRIAAPSQRLVGKV